MPQFKSINALALSFVFGSTLTSVHDHWKNHSFDYRDLCGQSNVSAAYMDINHIRVQASLDVS